MAEAACKKKFYLGRVYYHGALQHTKEMKRYVFTTALHYKYKK